MAIAIEFYTFTKKTNSTAAPGKPNETLMCNLIEPTDIIYPTIALVHSNPTRYNYCAIPHLNRYYFINNWEYSAGRWICTCSVDFMASWKNYIGSQSQYILRSSAANDGTIVDMLYPTTSNVVQVESLDKASSEVGDMFVSDINEGVYVVGIVNNDGGAIGCVSYYVFSNGEFRSFCSALMGDPSWFYSGIEEIGEDLAKAIFNPFQYVVSCMWFPVRSLPTSGGGAISYGWYTLPGSYGSKLASDSMRLASAAFDIPKHPQEYRGTYLNTSPFSRYTLFIPCFGMLPLNANLIGNSNLLNIQCFIDPVSGGGVLNVFADNVSIYTAQTQIGVPIQIAQMNSSFLNLAGSALNIASGIISGNVAGAISGIADGVSNTSPQVATMGTNGMISAYSFPPRLKGEFFTVVDEDNEHRGRPLCAKMAPASLGGYVLAADVEVEIPCTENEKNMIVQAMERGFYYE